jgi:energy-coupling factor transport system substrate-specific component
VGKGLGFDAIHAAGCLAFALAFGPALIRSVTRFARRLQITWIRPGSTAPLAAVVLALALAAGASSPERARGAGSPLTYLVGAENSDGGFGAAPGQPSAALYTGWAALGLASAGQDLQRLRHGSGALLTYVRGNSGAGADVGSLERTILVARVARLSPRHLGGRDLVSALRHHLRADGSVADQVNLTSFAVLALRAAGSRVPARTYAWLEHQQSGGGGFSFAGAGGASDIDDTGAALEALRRRSGRVTARAIAYLRRHQNRDGGFPQQPGDFSNAQSTAWAIQGLVAAGVGAASLHRRGSPSPLAYLRALVAADGHVRYARGTSQTPVWVTGEALMALEGKPLPLAPPPRAHVPAHPAASHTTTSAAGSGSPPSATASSSGANPAGGSSPRTEPRIDHRTRVSSAPGVPPPPGQAVIGHLASAAGFATALVLAPLGVG